MKVKHIEETMGRLSLELQLTKACSALWDDSGASFVDPCEETTAKASALQFALSQRFEHEKKLNRTVSSSTWGTPPPLAVAFQWPHPEACYLRETRSELQACLDEALRGNLSEEHWRCFLLPLGFVCRVQQLPC